MIKINLSSEYQNIIPNQKPYDKYIPLAKQFTKKELRLAIIKGSAERRRCGNTKA